MLVSYPSITKDEFETACINMERRSHDRLSRTDWLSVKWTGHELLIAQSRLASSQIEDTNASSAENEELHDQIMTDGADEEEAVREHNVLVVSFEISLIQTSSSPKQTRGASRSTFRLSSLHPTQYQFCGSRAPT